MKMFRKRVSYSYRRNITITLIILLWINKSLFQDCDASEFLENWKIVPFMIGWSIFNNNIKSKIQILNNKVKLLNMPSIRKQNIKPTFLKFQNTFSRWPFGIPCFCSILLLKFQASSRLPFPHPLPNTHRYNHKIKKKNHFKFVELIHVLCNSTMYTCHPHMCPVPYNWTSRAINTYSTVSSSVFTSIDPLWNPILAQPQPPLQDSFRAPGITITQSSHQSQVLVQEDSAPPWWTLTPPTLSPRKSLVLLAMSLKMFLTCLITYLTSL